MPITKHKTFKIAISDNSKFNISNTAENSINTFLAEPNNVYVNHSITTLTEDIEKYGKIKTVCKYLLVSLIYRDLNATPLDLTGVSKKLEKTVRKEIESGTPIEEPNILTGLDKEILKFESKDKQESPQKNTLKLKKE